MSSSKVLLDYYGKEAMKLLNPSIVAEGRKVILVKVQHSQAVSPANSSIGYVLIKKGGSFYSSPFEVLHEGIPTQKDMDRMMKIFQKRER